MIRKIEIRDSEPLLNFFKELVVSDPERVERPEDVGKITEEMEREWIKQKLVKEDKKDIFILCGLNDEEKMVIEGEVERLPRWIERHVAEIRFGLLPGYESIGEELVKKLIKTAEENRIEILIYFHLETQKTGLEIMKKLGFELMGTVKKYYKREAEYIDRVYLVKYL
jgi:hypothetical protein